MVTKYLVGGAVRDALLGKTIKDRDWVVVGASIDSMLEHGFIPVGKDFPVFLHPKTREEYALARTERKTGKGYKGFSFYADESITLTQDLKRRDLTINAIAMDKNKNIIDPFNGTKDLQDKILRHVSDAFIEDPVRVLRLARFMAKFPDFNIAESTSKLVFTMINNNELDHLVYERVWQETIKSLELKNPTKFFVTLNNFNILNSVTKIWSTPPNFSCITNINLSGEQKFWFSCINQDINKATNIKHTTIPKNYREPAIWNLQAIWQDMQINAESLVDVCNNLDAYRRPERFLSWIYVCQNHPCLKTKYKKLWQSLIDIFNVTKDVNIKSINNQNLKGDAIREAINQAKILQAKTILP